MCRVLRLTIMAVLVLLTGSLFVACGSGVQGVPEVSSTPTPHAATGSDVELLKGILRTNAEEVKSYHKVLELTGDLYDQPGTKTPVTRLEVDVEGPGRTHSWGVYLDNPSESYVLGGIAYMKDSTGNWVEQESSVHVETTGGTIFLARPETIDEADRVMVFDPTEKINGVTTQHFLWEKRETSGWFTGGNFTYQVWVDPQTKFAQKSQWCIWAVAPSGSPAPASPGSSATPMRLPL